MGFNWLANHLRQLSASARSQCADCLVTLSCCEKAFVNELHPRRAEFSLEAEHQQKNKLWLSSAVWTQSFRWKQWEKPLIPVWFYIHRRFTDSINLSHTFSVKRLFMSLLSDWNRRRWSLKTVRWTMKLLTDLREQTTRIQFYRSGTRLLRETRPDSSMHLQGHVRYLPVGRVSPRMEFVWWFQPWWLVCRFLP